jgi:hypothetical protein
LPRPRFYPWRLQEPDSIREPDIAATTLDRVVATGEYLVGFPRSLKALRLDHECIWPEAAFIAIGLLRYYRTVCSIIEHNVRSRYPFGQGKQANCPALDQNPVPRRRGPASESLEIWYTSCSNSIYAFYPRYSFGYLWCFNHRR